MQTLPAGSYRILALSEPSGGFTTPWVPAGTGSYRLRVREAPSCSPVGALQLGQTVTGALDDDDCLLAFGVSRDNWSLSLASWQRVRVDLKSSDFDPGILVQDQQERNGAWSFGVEGPLSQARAEAGLSAGEWTIAVTGRLNNSTKFPVDGTYELAVEVAPPCSPGTDLVFGVTVTGDISLSDCYVGTWADSFEISITEETAITVHLQMARGLVILRDENRTEIAMGLDGFPYDGNAWITKSLSPGSYTLLVKGRNRGPMDLPSHYQLTVCEIVCDDP